MNLRHLLPLIVLPLAACEDGTVTLRVTDAPVDDATSVIIEFTGVEIENENGEIEEQVFDPAIEIDLLDLEDGDSELLLDEFSLPADDYVSIRLKIEADGTVAHSRMTVAGVEEPLELIGGQLKMSRDFTVDEGEDIAFTVDFDLRKSILSRTGDEPFPLEPVLRLVRDKDAGMLTGTVTRTPCASPAVYVFTEGTTPRGVNGSSSEPVNTGRVEGGQYRVRLLPNGDYTAALTCNADQDDPEQSDDQDDVSFEATQDFTISDGADEAVNFP